MEHVMGSGAVTISNGIAVKQMGVAILSLAWQ
jgi:hypothetical protein